MRPFMEALTHEGGGNSIPPFVREIGLPFTVRWLLVELHVPLANRMPSHRPWGSMPSAYDAL